MVQTEHDTAVGNTLSASAQTGELTLQILVVDDHPDLLGCSKAQVTRGGSMRRVRPLQLAKNPSLPVDLVITDINIPEMNGIELARRSQSLGPEPRVMFVSACPGSFLAEEVGAQAHFLPKPFTRAALLAKISAGLSIQLE